MKTNNKDVVENFEKKFKEICIEGKRKSLNSSSTMFTEQLPSTYYTEAELKKRYKQCIWEQNLRQERDTMELIHLASNELNPKIEEIGLFHNQDMIPD